MCSQTLLLSNCMQTALKFTVAETLQQHSPMILAAPALHHSLVIICLLLCLQGSHELSTLCCHGYLNLLLRQAAALQVARRYCNEA